MGSWLWHAQLCRDHPVEGLERLDLWLEGLGQSRAMRCMLMAPCEGRVGISGGGIIREQLLLPGSVCLKPRCGRASTAERSKGRVLWEQIAPAKAIRRDVRPGLPIAHPWSCCWARLCGVLGSSPNRQSGAGKLLLSRELWPCYGKQLSLVLTVQFAPLRSCCQVKPARSRLGRALAPHFLLLPRAGKPWDGKLSFGPAEAEWRERFRGESAEVADAVSRG